MVLTKSAAVILLPPCDAVAFPVLLLAPVVGVGVVGGGVGTGVGVVLHVELSVPGPHPDVGVVGGGGVSVVGACVSPPPAGGACVSPPPALLSSPLAVAANIPSIRIPATK